jgi:small subunit ribosomal protein S19
MSRSSKKGPFVNQKLLDKVMKQKETGDSSPIKTWARNSQVFPEMVNHTIAIHDGKKHVNVYISEMMIGHYLGEFVPTRTFRSHGKVTKRTADKT